MANAAKIPRIVITTTSSMRVRPCSYALLKTLCLPRPPIIGRSSPPLIRECRHCEAGLIQVWPPTLANMSHIGRNTPSASTSTTPPTTTISAGSITELKFFS